MNTSVETTSAAESKVIPGAKVPATLRRGPAGGLELLPLLLVGLGLSAALFLAGPKSPGVLRTVADLAPLIAALAGAVACAVALLRLRHLEGRAAWAWRLMTAALMCHAVGRILQISFEYSKRPIPTPSAVDVWWVMQMPLMWIAVLLLAWPGVGAAALRVMIDALIMVLAALVMLWTLLLEPRFANENMTTVQKALSLYYPLTNIALLFCVSVLLSSTRSRMGLTRAAGLLLCGVLAFIGTNLVYSYLVLYKAYKLSAVTDAGWVWSCLLIGMAALAHSSAVLRHRSTPVPAEGLVAHADEGLSLDEDLAPPMTEEAVRAGVLHPPRGLSQLRRPLVIWFPYLAAIAASGVLLVAQLRRDRAETIQNLAPVLSLLFAIVARQMLTLWDNLHLSERLHVANSDLSRVNDELEGHVRERTRHLTTLHGITSTLNTSVDRRTVLRVALEKTMTAIGATGGGIWLRVSEKQQSTSEVPRDPTLRGGTTQQVVWTLVHSHGFKEDDPLQAVLRDLAVAAAEEQEPPNANLLRGLSQEPVAIPPPDRLILVPIRWQGSPIGVLALLRDDGDFSFEDRALVESVGLEAGTALQNVRLYQEARHRADRDGVTGLLNHRAMQEQLNAGLAQARRLSGEISIVLMDLNNFKFFNDTYGHQVGDDVLRIVARTLQKVFRASDVIGRYGGDEFIALLPDTDAEGSQIACQRVAAALDNEHFEAEGVRIPITMAYGTATFPRDGAAALELLTQADSSLFDYKNTGGARPITPGSAVEAGAGNLERRRLKSRVTGGSFGVLDALVTAIDNKDRYTRRHSEEVTQMALMIAQELEYSEESLRAVRISGLLHDVGKIAVPDEILRLPGKLSDEQWEIMKQHPVFGALIVKDLPHLDEVLAGVKYHHERYDGKGYPDGLAGDDIPMMGRILAIPDCYSAMTTDRPYRKGFEPEQALAEIERCKGTQFDPVLATIFIRAMQRELEHNGDTGSTPEDGNASTSKAPSAAPSDGSVAPQLSGTP